MSFNHKCLGGCNKTITWRFAICTDCEKKYGSSMYDWPDWLQYLWKEELRERRRQKRQIKHEVDFDPTHDYGRNNGKKIAPARSSE